jgi:hypothetical protein
MRLDHDDLYSGFRDGCGDETKLGESVRATFLFATPTWQEGVGRLVDFGDSLTEYNRTDVPADPDARAIAQEWLAVGDYLRNAMYGLGQADSE